MLRLKDLPPSERPLERLLSLGSSSLSNVELLCIILNSGTETTPVEWVAKEVLQQIDAIQDLKELTLEQLIQIKGIGTMKAARILACLELGNRVNQEKEQLYQHKIVNAQWVFRYYHNLLKDRKQEEFHCLYLDSQKRVIKEQLLFLGTVDFSLVHPREIFKEAYRVSASSIICVHNHPAGSVTPSKQDIELTKLLLEAGSLLGIPMNDHIIIGSNNYYSFFEQHQIEVAL